MAEIFAEVHKIKRLMEQIRDNIQKIQSFFDKMGFDVNTSVSPEESDELQDILQATNRLSQEVRDRLKALRGDTTQPDSPEKRMRTTLHATNTKKFMELMNHYQALQNNYKDKYRARIHRQAQIGSLNLS
jgi:t-SNARE complex subunit (syntaxin)